MDSVSNSYHEYKEKLKDLYGTERNQVYEQLVKQSQLDSKSHIDLIHKTIDDAVKNKDRYVHLLITDNGISMLVYPYEQGYPKWLKVIDDTCGKQPFKTKAQFRCPECGSYSKFMTPYCPICGVQLSVCDA